MEKRAILSLESWQRAFKSFSRSIGQRWDWWKELPFTPVTFILLCDFPYPLFIGFFLHHYSICKMAENLVIWVRENLRHGSLLNYFKSRHVEQRCLWVLPWVLDICLSQHYLAHGRSYTEKIYLRRCKLGATKEVTKIWKKEEKEKGNESWGHLSSPGFSLSWIH